MADSISSKLFLFGKRLLTIAVKNPRGLRPVLGVALSETENHLAPARDTARLPVVIMDRPWTRAVEVKPGLPVCRCADWRAIAERFPSP